MILILDGFNLAKGSKKTLKKVFITYLFLETCDEDCVCRGDQITKLVLLKPIGFRTAQKMLFVKIIRFEENFFVIRRIDLR